jgi:hypothetical protein
MGADNFRDEWVETPNQFASRVVIMRERSLNQRACIRIIHVVQIVSTLSTMTRPRASWLQVCPKEWRFRSRAVAARRRANRRGDLEIAVPCQEKTVTSGVFVRSSAFETGPERFRGQKETKHIMKRNLLTLGAVGAIALGGFAIAQGQGPGRWHGEGLSLEHLTKTLSLTSDQQAKVGPILNQAKPQLSTIHQDAMQKTQAVMDNTMSQIRPLLTAGQQKKFDDLQKARQDMRTAQQELHNALKE